MSPIVKVCEPIDGGQCLQVTGVLLRLAALSDRERQPSQQQQAKHDTSAENIEDLRHQEQNRLTQNTRRLRREQSVQAAEVKTEISILKNVPDGVDSKHGEKETRRAERALIADIE